MIMCSSLLNDNGASCMRFSVPSLETQLFLHEMFQIQTYDVAY